MKHTALILLLAASTVAASAQAPTQPANPATKSAVAPAVKPAGNPVRDSGQSWWSRHFGTASKPTAPTAKAEESTSPSVAAIIKAPAGIPVVEGIQEPIFTVALRYQEIEVGKGAVAEPGKLYKVLYTGYRASDGVIFDSSDKHRLPLRDKDGKPVLGDDGKPKLDKPQPMPFPQGVGGTIPGFDQGFVDMRVGGKRRIFIPWQMGYGTRNMPDRGPDHPGIPAKSDLIFDVELVDVTDAPPPQAHPNMMPGMNTPPKPGVPGAPAAPNTAPAPATAPKPTPPAAPAAAPAAPAPAATPAPPAPAATQPK